MLAFFLLNYSFHTVSYPANAHTLSNPSFTAYLSDYEFYLGHSDIGAVNFFDLSARFSTCGIGFSSYYTTDAYATEKRNWLSAAYHPPLPLSVGVNLGLLKFQDNTDALVDVGIWSRYLFNFGLCYGNLFGDDKALKVGGSYNYEGLVGTLEFENPISNQRLTVHALLSYERVFGDLRLKLCTGYHPRRFVWALEIVFQEFIHVSFFSEETPTLLVGVNFSPPVNIKEIAVVETLMVEKPLIVKKTRRYELTKKDLDFCEKHYRKGIEYYLNNQFDKAIDEWNRVAAIYPQYKDVARYMDTAKKKQQILEE